MNHLAPAKKKDEGKIDPIKLATAIVSLITALNFFVSFWGFSNAKEISDTKQHAIESDQEITKIKKDLYVLYAGEAEREIIQLLKEFPGLELTGNRKDDILAQIKARLQSIEQFDEKIISPQRTRSQCLAHAVISYVASDYDGTINSMMKYDRDIPEKYWLLGNAYLRKNNFKRSEEMYLKVEELSKSTRRDPIRARSIANRGSLELLRGNSKEALKLYDQALKIDPEQYGIHLNRAAAFVAMNDDLSAINSLCIYSKNADSDVIKEIETDKDQSFKELQERLGSSWKSTLKRKLQGCT